MALDFYSLRMWIEEMFGDFNKHGFDLESTMLRHLVDRNDRRDLSVFQIGLRFIDRGLTNALPFRIPLFTYS